MVLPRSTLLELAEYANCWLAYRQRTLDIPGVQAAVAHEGNILCEIAHGVSDTSTRSPLTPGHLFRIASQSKAFTATAIMQLVEEQKVRPDDPVGQYVEWLNDTPEQTGLSRLSICDLLRHSSGITRDGIDGDYWQLMAAFPDESALRDLVAAIPPVFEANDRFHYSNVGYSLLGLVINRASGRTYGDYVQKHIIDRLDLRDTAPEYRIQDLPRYAAGHTHHGDGLPRLPIDHISTHAMSSATGFTSTASDLTRFFSAHCFGNDSLLKDSSKRLMQHPHWTQHDGEHYGLGLQILDVGKRRLIGHSGGYPGHCTKTWCDPKEQIVISVLTNAIDGPASELSKGLFRLFDYVSQFDSAKPEHAGIDLRRYCGRFVNLWGAYDLVSFGDRLLLIPLDSNDPVASIGELTVETDTVAQFSAAHDGYSSEGERFTFDRAPDGTITRVKGLSSMSAYHQDVYERGFLATDRVTLRNPSS